MNRTILRRHRLHHLRELPVSEKLLAGRFSSSCATGNCTAACCRYGVFVDISEKENILAHTSLIQRHLEPGQEHDPEQWFEPEGMVDADFPSGHAIGTQYRDHGCVFLDRSGRCTLQKAAVAEGMDRFALKPFFCVAFPITVEHGTLTLDEPDFAKNPACCGTVTGGPATVFDVCSEELQFVLGEDGFAELQSIMNEPSSHTKE